LASFGIRGLPSLVDHLPELVAGMGDVTKVMGVPGPHPRPEVVLSYRGEDGGAGHGLPEGLYFKRGGLRPVGDTGRVIRVIDVR
jgi:hypothetical protein